MWSSSLNRESWMQRSTLEFILYYCYLDNVSVFFCGVVPCPFPFVIVCRALVARANARSLGVRDTGAKCVCCSKTFATQLLILRPVPDSWDSTFIYELHRTLVLVVDSFTRPLRWRTHAYNMWRNGWRSVHFFQTVFGKK